MAKNRTYAEWAKLGIAYLASNEADEPPMSMESLRDVSALALGAFTKLGLSGFVGIIAVVYVAGRKDALAEAADNLNKVDARLEKIS